MKYRMWLVCMFVMGFITAVMVSRTRGTERSVPLNDGDRRAYISYPSIVDGSGVSRKSVYLRVVSSSTPTEAYDDGEESIRTESPEHETYWIVSIGKCNYVLVPE